MEPLDDFYLEMGRDALAQMRSMIESTHTEAVVDAALKSYLMRVVDQLQGLFDPEPTCESEMRILAQALHTFLPVLDLDWLPSAEEGLPKPTPEAEAHIHALRLERARHAAHRETHATDERWDALTDLVSESLENFILFDYQEGVNGCIELLEAIDVHVLASRPADA